MNIEHARSIALSAILEKIGFLPAKQTDKDLWYLSPLRKENTPSFHVDVLKNLWYDFGEDIGGDNIAFVRAYLKSTNENDTVSDAMRWMKNMLGNTPGIKNVRIPQYSQEDKKLALKDVKPIRHLALIQYLKSRGIPFEIGKTYLKEVTIYNSEKKKTYFALGFQNEENGYELRNPYFKGCIRPKDITFIRGTVIKPKGIHIFEGFMDYLSLISQRNGTPLENDAIILNSLSCMKKATGYIKGYGYTLAFTWLDNNPAGEKATKAFTEFFKGENIRHRIMNDVFAPYEDVNAWHMNKLGLKL